MNSPSLPEKMLLFSCDAFLTIKDLDDIILNHYILKEFLKKLGTSTGNIFSGLDEFADDNIREIYFLNGYEDLKRVNYWLRLMCDSEIIERIRGELLQKNCLEIMQIIEQTFPEKRQIILEFDHN